MDIGSRGIDIAELEFTTNWNGSANSANRLHWSAGTVSYINDGGTAVSVNVITGSVLWSSGTVYVYWAKGATALSTTTSAATAYSINNVVLATYRGGINLVATYGRTIIDGAQIKTQSILTDQLAANSVTASRMVI